MVELSDSPEAQLLLLCAQMRRSAAMAAHIDLLAERVNPTGFARLVSQNEVSALVYEALDSHPSGGLATAIRQAAVENAASSVRLAGGLLDILTLLDKAGVEAVPLKGAALAAQIYHKLSVRQFGDLDILVRRRDVRAAYEVLAASLGFTGALRNGDLARQLGSRRQKHVSLMYQASGLAQPVVVEIHWAFHERDYRFGLAADDVFSEAVPVSLLGRTVRAPHPRHLLPLLCVHACRHGWESLKWVCDIAAFVQTYPSHLGSAIELAGGLGCRRMVLLGLYLAADLLGTAVPLEVSEQIGREAALNSLCTQIRPRLLSSAMLPAHGSREAASEGINSFEFDMRCRERFRDRIGLAAARMSRLLEPNEYDGAAEPLRWIRRPFRLWRDYGLRAAVATIRSFARVR